MGQDLPPTGGYEPVQYKRNLPARGFRPAYYLLAMGAIMTYGFIKVGKGIREQNELAREKMWSRIYLIPLLQAEEDRDLVRKHYADLAREKQLMGKETSAYNSDRHVLPHIPRFLTDEAGAKRRGRDWFALRFGTGEALRRKEHERMLDEARIELTTLVYRFVRPTFAVTPANNTK